MPHSEAWTRLEDAVLIEAVGFTAADACEAVNSLRRSLKIGEGDGTERAVEKRMRKLGVRYKRERV